ncbi:MAG: YkgJ family cysteine cluster protein [Candidatus Latescibacterota bacterium]|nr:YkgJ family cysteine cluster protein [Candidatus Latescibacterota bacterium]
MTTADREGHSAEAESPAQLAPEDAEDLRMELQTIYDEVPSTCCANSGECCSLTDSELDEGYATMFPLYQAEYLNIVEYVRRAFPAERQRQLLAFTQERPMRCPFLGNNDHCTIYAVRPLICRTYAVMNPQTIREAAERHHGELPEDWIRGFTLRESGMVCPRVTVTQPERLVKHAQNLITFAYERALTRLSRKTALVPLERRKIIRGIIRQRSWPVRWTWGGYNALRQTSTQWIRDRLREYWKKADLKDLG